MNRFSIRLLGFVVLSVTIFAALLLAWPLVGEIYGSAFRSCGNVLNDGGPSRDVWFTTLDSPSTTHDARIRLVNRSAELQQSHEISSRRHGYMPTAFLMALVLATPISWRRRVWALLWGMFWVNLYVALKLLLLPAAYPVLAPGVAPGVLSRMLSQSFWVLSATSAGWMMVPLVIWLPLIIPSKKLLVQETPSVEV